MSYEQFPAATAALRRRTAALTRCWRILRLDGNDYRYTAHDQIVHARQFYGCQPLPGIMVQGERSTSGFQENRTTMVGVLDDRGANATGITAEDIRAGRLWGALAFELFVNWEFPWHYPIRSDVWHVRDIRRPVGGRRFELQLSGLTLPTKERTGDNLSRDCPNILGQFDGVHSFCTVNLNVPPFKVNGVVTGTAAPTKRIVNATGFDQTEHADGFFDGGFVTVSTGANAGLEMEILGSLDNGGTEFQLDLIRPFPFSFAVGDTFVAYAGCDRRFETCRDKFGKHKTDFAGLKDMRGTDELLVGASAT